MWEKFAEEICDTLDRSVERVEKRCDNWKEFIDGKKELNEVTKEFNRGFISEDLGPKGMSCSGDM